MTDREIICTFMEQKPKRDPVPFQKKRMTKDGWWLIGRGPKWYPRRLTLDALWEVEERLTDEQTALYCTALDRETRSPEGVGIGWRFVHATPEQKIKALAAVLRPVEHRV